MSKVLKTASAAEITAAAEEAARKHAERDICDPQGAWSNWRSINGLWNSWSYETSKQVEREAPIAHKLFTHVYLTTQGWKKS